jgi:hypothetical protein
MHVVYLPCDDGRTGEVYVKELHHHTGLSCSPYAFDSACNTPFEQQYVFCLTGLATARTGAQAERSAVPSQRLRAYRGAVGQGPLRRAGSPAMEPRCVLYHAGVPAQQLPRHRKNGPISLREWRQTKQQHALQRTSNASLSRLPFAPVPASAL